MRNNVVRFGSADPIFDILYWGAVKNNRGSISIIHRRPISVARVNYRTCARDKIKNCMLRTGLIVSLLIRVNWKNI